MNHTAVIYDTICIFERMLKQQGTFEFWTQRKCLHATFNLPKQSNVNSSQILSLAMIYYL